MGAYVLSCMQVLALLIMSAVAIAVPMEDVYERSLGNADGSAMSAPLMARVDALEKRLAAMDWSPLVAREARMEEVSSLKSIDKSIRKLSLIRS